MALKPDDILQITPEEKQQIDRIEETIDAWLLIAPDRENNYINLNGFKELFNELNPIQQNGLNRRYQAAGWKYLKNSNFGYLDEGKTTLRLVRKYKEIK